MSENTEHDNKPEQEEAIQTQQEQPIPSISVSEPVVQPPKLMDLNDQFAQLVNQQGLIAPTVTTIIRQFQNDLNRYLNEKLILMDVPEQSPARAEKVGHTNDDKN